MRASSRSTAERIRWCGLCMRAMICGVTSSHVSSATAEAPVVASSSRPRRMAASTAGRMP
eukprot:scaffold36200_cov63-Phaeocystis_antarctica.AAC.6